jgi:hypothetical protein
MVKAIWNLVTQCSWACGEQRHSACLLDRDASKCGLKWRNAGIARVVVELHEIDRDLI